MLAMLTMCDPGLLLRTGNSSRTNWIGASKLIDSNHCHCWAVMSSVGPAKTTPALLTRMCSWPQREHEAVRGGDLLAAAQIAAGGHHFDSRSAGQRFRFGESRQVDVQEIEMAPFFGQPERHGAVQCRKPLRSPGPFFREARRQRLPLGRNAVGDRRPGTNPRPQNRGTWQSHPI